jgi:transposase
MIGLPNGARVWLACGLTDLRNGFDGLARLLQTKLAEDPLSGQLFVFRGRRGDRLKVLWWDGDGLCLFAKRLERGRLVWAEGRCGRGACGSARTRLAAIAAPIWPRPTNPIRIMCTPVHCSPRR